MITAAKSAATSDAYTAATLFAAAALVHLRLEFQMSLETFAASEQLKLRESLALAAGLTRADAYLVTLELRAVAALLREAGGGVQVDAFIACYDAVAAAMVAASLTSASIGIQLLHLQRSCLNRWCSLRQARTARKTMLWSCNSCVNFIQMLKNTGNENV